MRSSRRLPTCRPAWTPSNCAACSPGSTTKATLSATCSPVPGELTPRIGPRCWYGCTPGGPIVGALTWWWSQSRRVRKPASAQPSSWSGGATPSAFFRANGGYTASSESHRSTRRPSVRRPSRPFRWCPSSTRSSTRLRSTRETCGSTPTGPRVPVASTSTSPIQRSALHTCRPGS